MSARTMDWRNDILDALAREQPCGYHRGSAPGTEPTALAAIALALHDRAAQAERALDWLAKIQSKDGSVGVSATESTPCWPTALAILAWAQAPNLSDRKSNIDAAVQWLLTMKGQTRPRAEDVAHDSTLTGWPWVAGTHSWIEPTALAVLALRATGRGAHLRTREAIHLLTDRLLPRGGCNYGNTFVLGQQLRPHVQPTGLTLLALSNEQDTDGKIEWSLAYLEQELSANTTTASLCFGLMGLAAHRRRAAEADNWLEVAYTRLRIRDPSGYKLALLALATSNESNPLLPRAPMAVVQ